mmetsp:Transcript_19716/g.36316  ORF Transcript_19716/g.36316 Transcript_19716/m.36316 type:complete len:246 (+) Transcript_19716:7385-8122(+)
MASTNTTSLRLNCLQLEGVLNSVLPGTVSFKFNRTQTPAICQDVEDVKSLRPGRYRRGSCCCIACGGLKLSQKMIRIVLPLKEKHCEEDISRPKITWDHLRRAKHFLTASCAFVQAQSLFDNEGSVHYPAPKLHMLESLLKHKSEVKPCPKKGKALHSRTSSIRQLKSISSASKASVLHSAKDIAKTSPKFPPIKPTAREKPKAANLQRFKTNHIALPAIKHRRESSCRSLTYAPMPESLLRTVG